jgi:hypothetical protein
MKNKNITITKIIKEKSKHLIIINLYIPPNKCENREKTIEDIDTYLETIYKVK